MEDGTCSQVVSVEHSGQDTNTQEEAGNNKHFFIDVWVRNSILVDRMREQSMVAGDWMRMDKVKCFQEGEGGELPSVFMFIMQYGGITKLGEGDLQVACMRERIGEDRLKSQADMLSIWRGPSTFLTLRKTSWSWLWSLNYCHYPARI